LTASRETATHEGASYYKRQGENKGIHERTVESHGFHEYTFEAAA
jgi:hypothetical protein